MFPNYLKKTLKHAEIQESQDTEPYQNQPLHKDLTMNLESIQTEMGHSKDVIIRKFMIAETIDAVAVVTEGLSDPKTIADFVSRSVVHFEDEAPGQNQAIYTEAAFQQIKEQLSSFASITEISDWKQLFLSLLSGDSVLMFQGS